MGGAIPLLRVYAFMEWAGRDLPFFFIFIELNRLYTTRLTVVILQLVTSATRFGLAWPSSGLQRLVSIKVHNVAEPMGSHGLQCTATLCALIDTNLCKPDDGQARPKRVADVTSCRITTVNCVV